MADYFAQLNNKMGGDLKKIQIVGEYMVEIWKAVGMDMSRVQVSKASISLLQSGTMQYSSAPAQGAA